MKDYTGSLVSTWPVITEACHLLDFDQRAQVNLLRWLERGAVHMFDVGSNHFGGLIALFEKYGDLPVDLADATLLVAAESLGINNIISLDSDFNVYRIGKNKRLKNLLSA